MLEHVRKVHSSGPPDISKTSKPRPLDAATPQELVSQQDSVASPIPTPRTIIANEQGANYYTFLRQELEAAEAEKANMDRAFEDEVEALRIVRDGTLREVERKIKALAAAVQVMGKGDVHDGQGHSRVTVSA